MPMNKTQHTLPTHFSRPKQYFLKLLCFSINRDFIRISFIKISEDRQNGYRAHFGPKAPSY